jgi:hypothetical protein
MVGGGGGSYTNSVGTDQNNDGYSYGDGQVVNNLRNMLYENKIDFIEYYQPLESLHVKVSNFFNL